MARGQQKIQSQQKAAEKAAKLKKQKGHDQKSAAAKALTFKCKVCMVRMAFTAATNMARLFVSLFGSLGLPPGLMQYFEFSTHKAFYIK